MKKARLIALYTLLFLCIIFIAANRKPTVTYEDRAYIDSFLHKFHIAETPEQVHANFNSELAFIQKMDDSIVTYVHHEEISNSHFGSVKYYFENGKGFCYDRAVLLEKIFKSYHFNFRHVFVYYRYNENSDPSRFDILRKGTGSHALTEIETQKGWMAIGTNANWIGISKNGDIYSVEDLKKQVDYKGSIELQKDCSCGTAFWKDHPHFKYVYGLYSRNGRFFSRIGGIPEINVKMLFYNFL